MKNIKDKKRLSNLELLRIISMILIVSSHYAMHSPEFTEGLTINRYILEFISLGGKIGVNCFILITGFFLVKSKFKLEKFVKLVIEVFTYSIFMFIITIIFTDKKIGIMDLMKTFLPIIYSNYWFVTNYVVLYIMAPFINRLIANIDEREYQKLILILFIVLSVIPTFTGANFVYSNLIWFIFLYLVAGYIRLYYKTKSRKNLYLYIAIGMYLLIFLLGQVILKISVYIPKLADNSMFFAETNKVPALICSICLFIFFKELKIQYNKYINLFAESTFAIYLLHDNYLFKKYLWANVLKNANYYNSIFMTIHYIVSIILIFMVGTIIETIRKKIMDRPVETIAKRARVFMERKFVYYEGKE